MLRKSTGLGKVEWKCVDEKDIEMKHMQCLNESMKNKHEVQSNIWKL
jgi:hypothetical protein